jgi:hypothetical protein
LAIDNRANLRLTARTGAPSAHSVLVGDKPPVADLFVHFALSPTLISFGKPCIFLDGALETVFSAKSFVFVEVR